MDSKDSQTIPLLRLKWAQRASQTWAGIGAAFITIGSLNALTGNITAIVVLVAIVGVFSLQLLAHSFFPLGSAFMSLLISVLFWLVGLANFTKIHQGQSTSEISINIALSTFCMFSSYYYSLSIFALNKRLRVLPGKHALGKIGHAKKMLSWGLSARKIAASYFLYFLHFVIKCCSNYILIILIGIHLAAFCVLFSPFFSKNIDFDLSTIPTELIPQVIVGSILMVAAALILGLISTKLRHWSMISARIKYEDAIKKDPRPPILFLRSFSDDQVKLPTIPKLLRIWRGIPSQLKLDHLLVEEFSCLGPVVALGVPGEENLPYGAHRIYINRGNSDQEWQNKVVEIASNALAIIVISSNTKNLRWEIDTMLKEEFKEKTLFLASPRETPVDLSSHPILGPYSPTGSSSQKTVALFNKNNSWKAASSRHVHADDYFAAIRLYFFGSSS